MKVTLLLFLLVSHLCKALDDTIAKDELIWGENSQVFINISKFLGIEELLNLKICSKVLNNSINKIPFSEIIPEIVGYKRHIEILSYLLKTKAQGYEKINCKLTRDIKSLKIQLKKSRQKNSDLENSVETEDLAAERSKLLLENSQYFIDKWVLENHNARLRILLKLSLLSLGCIGWDQLFQRFIKNKIKSFIIKNLKITDSARKEEKIKYWSNFVRIVWDTGFLLGAGSLILYSEYN